MKLEGLLLAWGEAAKWRFDPFKDRVGGTLNLELPCRDLEGVFKLNVKVVIYDTFSPTRRAEHVFPSNLPLPDDWPFSYRVEVIRAEPSPFDFVPLGDITAGFGITGADMVTTINIRVFALQGVRVVASMARNDGQHTPMDPLRQSSGPLRLNVIIDKLYRPESLPVPGAPLHSDTLYPGHMVLAVPDDLLFSMLTRFTVQHVPNGVDITWTGTRQTLSLRLKKPGMAEAGFAYWFNPEPKPRRRDDFIFFDDFLHILVSGEVDIRLAAPVNPPHDTVRPNSGDVPVFPREEDILGYFVDPLAWEREHTDPVPDNGADPVAGSPDGVRDPDQFNDLLRPVSEARFFRVGTVASAQDLPPFGEPFTVRPEDDEAGDNLAHYMREDPFKVPLLAQAALDIGVSFIPIVGDIADFAEFNYAMATGKDRWGREVETWELVLMGISVIPLVGLPFDVVKRARRVL